MLKKHDFPEHPVRGRKFARTVNKSNLLTVRATFLQIKLWKSKLEGEMHPNIKIQVSCDKKQNTLGSSYNDIIKEEAFGLS